MAAEPRYRADEPYPGEYRVTDVLEKRYVATCRIERMAKVIAAALNAVEDAGRVAEAVIKAHAVAATLNATEDAGRWKAALERYGRRMCMAQVRPGIWGREQLRKAAGPELEAIFDKLFPAGETVNLGDEWECPHESCTEIREALKAPEPKEATT